MEKMRLMRCVQKSRFLVHDGPNSSGSTDGLGGMAAATAAATAAAAGAGSVLSDSTTGWSPRAGL